MSTRKQLDRKSNNDGKLENHHILPISLGGTDDNVNMVMLTTREHFLAHLLLTKIYTGKDKAKMVYAFAKMCQCNPNQKRIVNSRYYSLAKHLMSQHCSGENSFWYGRTHSEETKKMISKQKTGEGNPMFGKTPWNKGKKLPPISQEHKDAVSIAHKGKVTTEETKLKMSLAAKGKPKSEEHKKKLSDVNKGKITSQETRDKISAIHKGKKQKELICPHCSKEGRGSSMIRWHFDKCQLKSI